jgi:hypothetical protein
MAVQAEPVRRGAEDVLEPLRRVAVSVERPRELEDEADRVGVGGSRVLGQRMPVDRGT